MGLGPGSWAAPFASSPRRLDALSAVRFSAHLWWENCHNLLTCATPRALSPFPLLFLPHTLAQPAAVSTLLLFFFVFLFSSLRFSFALQLFFLFFSSFFHFVFLSQRPRDDDSFGCLLVVLWYLIRICVAFICMTPPSATSSTSTTTPFCTQKAYQFTSH